MTKAEFEEILDHAFDEGTPFICYTEYYSFCLIPKGGKWLQVSYDFMDHEILGNSEIDGAEAFNQLCEELEKSLSAELEVFYLNRWKEFKDGLSGSGDENLKASIAELKDNTATYAENFPAIFSTENLSILKSKI